MHRLQVLIVIILTEFEKNMHLFKKFCPMYDGVKPAGIYIFQESPLAEDRNRKLVFSSDSRSLKHYFYMIPLIG